MRTLTENLCSVQKQQQTHKHTDPMDRWMERKNRTRGCGPLRICRLWASESSVGLGLISPNPQSRHVPAIHRTNSLAPGPARPWGMRFKSDWQNGRK